ncbi:MAG: 50S ribosomal protein L6 [Patescibacteria group bacterium]|nr:50S ribosomal protein L6 [Patescibacteria group bacterium]
MSRIGKQPIEIPEGIEIQIAEDVILVKNPKGEISVPRLHGITPHLDVESKELRFVLEGTGKQARSNWGTQRSLTQGAIEGLIKGFEKTLLLEGVGYRITKEGENLVMNLGFSHPVRYETKPGITFEVEKNSILKVKGISKELVGRVAAEIRSLKKPEPYKGKGFRYKGEIVRRKAGKRAATTAAGTT